MPQQIHMRDRFDDIPRDRRKVGAHRAEQPRTRGLVVFLWAAVATILLSAIGILAALVIFGKLSIFGLGAPGAAPSPTLTPKLDTTYSVLVLNATPDEARGAAVKSQLLGAGWTDDLVVVGDAATKDFAETTVYYALPGDEAAAAGLAEVIGGATLVQDLTYQPVDQADAKQLTVVIGATAPTPAP